jgi:hypothetical protein
MIKNYWNVGWSVIAIVLASGFVGCGDDDDITADSGGGDAAIDDAATENPPVGGEGGHGGKGGSGGKGGASGKIVAGSGGTAVGGASGKAGGGAAGTTSTCTTGVACAPSGSIKGFCRNNACTACTGTDDNDECETAYGANYMCVSGDCTQVECTDSNDCISAGKLCGTVTANFCGKCTADAQCQSAPYSAAFICVSDTCIQGNCHSETDTACTDGQVCNTNTCGVCASDTKCKTRYGDSYMCYATTGNAESGKCVANTCANTIGQACTANAADVCCTVNSANICVAGNCCSDAQCGAHQFCVSHSCTTCPAVSSTAPVYYVDPVNGSDSLGTGNNSTLAGCAFKTITKALSAITVITSAPTVATEIRIISGPVKTGETFPLKVPQNVLIASANTVVTSAVTVEVSANTVGFELTGANSALENLDIYGGDALVGVNGVLVTSANTTSLKNVKVHNFSGAGINVPGGKLAITEGVVVTSNGSTVASDTIADGLSVGNPWDPTYEGFVTIITSAGSVRFDNNTRYGIGVYGNGSIEIIGSASTTQGMAGIGTVTTNNNVDDGVRIAQLAQALPPINTITGLVSWGNGTVYPQPTGPKGSGVFVAGGSSLVLRHSYLLNNKANGVAIENTNDYTENYLVGNIDLGTVASSGRNTLQDGTNSNHVGIFVEFTENATTGTVSARGNIFSGKDCYTTAASLYTFNTGSPVDVYVDNNGVTTGTPLDVYQCTY